MNRTSTIVVITMGVTIVAGIAGSVWWWKTNAQGMMNAAKGAYEEGKKFGADTDENGCLTEAVKRQKIKDNQGVIASTRGGIILSACLHAAKPSEDFCKDVPTTKNPFEVTAWTLKTCHQHELTDNHCPSVIQQMANHCSSPMRMKKANANKNADK
jgi:hypothetical protein